MFLLAEPSAPPKGVFMQPRNLMVVLLCGLPLAGGLVATSRAGDSPDGRELFKEYCKPCHLPASKAGEYTPMTLIADQWKRFFEKKYVPKHKAVADEKHGGKPVTDVLSPEMLEKIRAFAVDHAADSEHPMTCG
jgi:hypothetical protein